jgi:hypothetical protein
MRSPNQLPDPTSPSVTPLAGARGAPSVAADHKDGRRKMALPLRNGSLRVLYCYMMTTPAPVLLLLSAFIASIASAQTGSTGLSTREADHEALLSLPWEQFDQTQNSGWRVYVNPSSKQYLEAAKLIETYLTRHSDLTARQRALSYFHAGMQYVFYAREHGGDPLAALPDLDKAIVSGKEPAHSVDWNDMVIATKAFLVGDRATLLAVKERLAVMPTASVEWPNYADDLLKNLGKPYGSWWPKEEPKK